jgi:hypothetical protein
MGWFVNPYTSIVAFWSPPKHGGLTSHAFLTTSIEVGVTGLILTLLVVGTSVYRGADDIERVLITGVTTSVVTGVVWFAVLPLMAFVAAIAVAFTVLFGSAHLLQKLANRRRATLDSGAVADSPLPGELPAEFQQRQELARELKFELSPPPDAAAIGAEDSLDLRFLLPEAVLTAPLSHTVDRCCLSFSDEKAARPAVRFPDASLAPDGTVASYGRRAVLYGVPNLCGLRGEPADTSLADSAPLGWLVPKLRS